MIFELENIGPIEKASIELGNLTLICGENNTGKTYLSYGVYGFFEHWHTIGLYKYINPYISERIPISKINESVQLSLTECKSFLEEEALNEMTKAYLAQLKYVFSANENEFTHSKFHAKKIIHIDEDYWKKQNCENTTRFINNKKIIKLEKAQNNFVSTKTERYLFLNKNTIEMFRNNIPEPFILSPERFTTRLFLPEIDKNRSDLVNRALQNGSGMTKEALEKEVGRYSLPIKKNIDFARDLTYTVKQNSFLQTEYPEIATSIEDMLNVEYTVVDGRLLVFDKRTEKMLPFDMASTSVRSLADLHLWLKHKAQKGNILFIDEPELSLHPSNQVKLMRLLVQLVNVGVKVFMTTHSDYMIKEMNNLLKLSYDFADKEAIMEELGYQQKDILQPGDLKAYIAKGGSVELVETDELGMLTSAFDEAIVQINYASNKLAGAVEDILATE